jgi:hypothetical protein
MLLARNSLLFIAFLSLCFQGEAMSQSNTMGPVINNQGIVTQGQIGNNTIVQPNPATFTFGAHTITPRPDGTFEIVVSSELVSQTLVKLLYVSVTGPHVTDFDFQPRMGGAFSYWYGTMNDNGAKARGFNNPQPGAYEIIVHTSKVPTPNDISIRYNIE